MLKYFTNVNDFALNPLAVWLKIIISLVWLSGHAVAPVNVKLVVLVMPPKTQTRNKATWAQIALGCEPRPTPPPGQGGTPGVPAAASSGSLLPDRAQAAQCCVCDGYWLGHQRRGKMPSRPQAGSQRQPRKRRLLRPPQSSQQHDGDHSPCSWLRLTAVLLASTEVLAAQPRGLTWLPPTRSSELSEVAALTRSQRTLA